MDKNGYIVCIGDMVRYVGNSGAFIGTKFCVYDYYWVVSENKKYITSRVKLYNSIDHNTTRDVDNIEIELIRPVHNNRGPRSFYCNRIAFIK
jgi:hypothetical protein